MPPKRKAISDLEEESSDEEHQTGASDVASTSTSSKPAKRASRASKPTLPAGTRNDLNLTTLANTHGYEDGEILKVTRDRISMTTLIRFKEGISGIEQRKAVEDRWEELIAERKGAVDQLLYLGHSPSISSCIISAPQIDLSTLINVHVSPYDVKMCPRISTDHKGDNVKIEIFSPNAGGLGNISFLIAYDDSRTPQGIESKIAAIKRKVRLVKPIDDENFKYNAKYQIYCYKQAGQFSSMRFVLPTNEPVVSLTDYTENHVFILDFPCLQSAPQTFRENETRTYFADKLYVLVYRLVFSDAQLAPFADNMKNFDFSKSIDYELFTSIAGEHPLRRQGKSKSEVDEGLLGLARAIRHRGFSRGGVCEVEYLTAVSEPIEKSFIQDLWISMQGVDLANSPPEVVAELRESYVAGSFKILYPANNRQTEQGQRRSVKGKNGFGSRFAPLGINSLRELDSSDARSEFVTQDFGSPLSAIMFDPTMKYDFPNHTTMFIVTNVKLEATPPICEAVVGLGSHSPTLASYGKLDNKSLKIKNTEVSVIQLIKAPDFETLQSKIDQIVPYKRKLQPYTVKDIPSGSDKEQQDFLAPKYTRKGAGKRKEGDDEGD